MTDALNHSKGAKISRKPTGLAANKLLEPNQVASVHNCGRLGHIIKDNNHRGKSQRAPEYGHRYLICWKKGDLVELTALVTR